MVSRLKKLKRNHRLKKIDKLLNMNDADLGHAVRRGLKINSMIHNKSIRQYFDLIVIILLFLLMIIPFFILSNWSGLIYIFDILFVGFWSIPLEDFMSIRFPKKFNDIYASNLDKVMYTNGMFLIPNQMKSIFSSMGIHKSSTIKDMSEVVPDITVFRDDVDADVLEDQQFWSDEDYGRFMRPFISYARLLTALDGEIPDDVLEKFKKDTDFETRVNDALKEPYRRAESSLEKKHELNEKMKREADDLEKRNAAKAKEYAYSQAQIASEMVGDSDGEEDADPDSAELRRLKDVDAKLKEKINELEAKVVRGQDVQDI